MGILRPLVLLGLAGLAWSCAAVGGGGGTADPSGDVTASAVPFVPRPLSPQRWWDDSRVLDLRERYPARCELHDVATEPREVEGHCGSSFLERLEVLAVDELAFYEAEETLFPRAHGYTFSYTINDQGVFVGARVLSCPACRDAEDTWFAAQGAWPTTPGAAQDAAPDAAPENTWTPPMG